jgi:hypothetical protein
VEKKRVNGRRRKRRRKKRLLPNVIDPMTKLVHMRAAKPKKQSYPHRKNVYASGCKNRSSGPPDTDTEKKLPTSPIPRMSFRLLAFFRTMESLSDTKWDVVISGTGLQQSLLAL